MKIRTIISGKERIQEFEEFVNEIPDSSIVLVAAEESSEIVKNLRKKGLNLILIENNQNIIKILLKLYSEKKIPSAIIFDNYSKVSAACYIHQIHINPSFHILRNIKIGILNYEDNNPVISKISVLAVNGSPRKNGDTKRMLIEEIEKYWTGQYYTSEIIDLENISECIACGGHQKNCKSECVINDQMRKILPKVKNSDVLLLASPVYMDLPTARTIAFLSRLTGQNRFNRFSYIGKYASVLSCGYCSGTKSVIKDLINALEMIGFTIQGRSTREYVQIWKDKKTRGGVPYDFSWPE